MVDSSDKIVSFNIGQELSTEQLEKIERTINIGLTVSLVKSVEQLDKKLDQVQELADKLFEAYKGRVEAQLDADTLDDSELFSMTNSFLKIMIDIIEVKRRISNGRNLVVVSKMSDQDRAFLDLLKMVKSKAKQEKLKKYVKKLIDGTGLNDYGEADDANN